MKIYSVYDVKTQIYNTPFVQVSDGAATRAFADLSNEKNTTISKHPDDYKLYALATYDEQTGAIESYTPPVYMATASEFVLGRPLVNSDDYYIPQIHDPNT